MNFGSATIDLKLIGIQQVRAAIAGIQGRLTRMQQATQGIARAGRRIMLAMTAAMTASVVAGARFEQRMARVRAITEATDEQFQHLEATARSLGETTMFSASQAAEAMSNLAIAGFTVNEIITAMPNALNLAAAGQLDMASAADIVAKVMRGMGLESGELAHSVDVLAKAFTTSNTDLLQLGDALKFVGPVARASGKNFEETVAALQVLSDAGLQASLAGTSLRRILSALSTTRTQRAFRKLGVEVVGVDGALRALPDIIEETNVAMQAMMGVAEQSAFAMEQFGQRGGPGFQVLLARGGEALRKFEVRLADAGGTAKRIADIQMDTLSGSFTILKSALEGLAITIKTIIGPTIRRLIDAMTVATGKVTRWAKAHKFLTGTIIATAIGLATLVAGIPVLLGLLKLLAIGFSLLLSPIGLVVAAIAGVATGLAYLMGTGDTVIARLKDGFGRLFMLIAKGGIGAYTAVEIAITHFGTVSRLVWAATKLHVVGQYEDMKHLFLVQIPEILDWFKANWKNILSDLAQLWILFHRNMQANVREAMAWILAFHMNLDWKGAFGNFVSANQRALNRIIDAHAEAFHRIWQFMRDFDWRKAWQGIERLPKDIGDALGQGIADAWAAADKQAKGFRSPFAGFEWTTEALPELTRRQFSTLERQLQKEIGELADKLADTFNERYQRRLEGLKDFLAKLREMMADQVVPVIPSAPGAAPGAAGGAGGGPGGVGAPTGGMAESVADTYRRIQQKLLGIDDQDKIRRATEKTAVTNAKIVDNTERMLTEGIPVKVGASTFGP